MRHRDRYSLSMNTDLDRLKAAYAKVAVMVTHDRAYVPIFQRIEREIIALKDEEDVVRRAQMAAQDYKAVG